MSEAQAERDAERVEKEKAISEKETAEKKSTFYKEFSKLSAEYKDAPEFADEIEAKVIAGYSPKDATVSVLMDKGKFTPPAKPVERQPIAGGSATTNLQTGGTKSASDMTREERRAALIEAEQRGDIGVN